MSAAEKLAENSDRAAHYRGKITPPVLIQGSKIIAVEARTVATLTFGGAVCSYVAAERLFANSEIGASALQIEPGARFAKLIEGRENVFFDPS